jgi:DNA mismatch endonuclease, patch repair protein
MLLKRVGALRTPVGAGTQRLGLRRRAHRAAEYDSGLNMGNPVPADDVTRRRLERQRRRDTKPELLLRSALWQRGLRYRVDYPVVGRRRRADIAFTRAKVAVFVDGCFWHGCPQHGTLPKNNADWWRAKLTANITRDRTTDRYLQEAGWLVMRFWEHDDPSGAADKVEQAVNPRR